MKAKRFKKLLMGGKITFMVVDGIRYDVILSRDFAEIFVNSVKAARGVLSYEETCKHIFYKCVEDMHAAYN